MSFSSRHGFGEEAAPILNDAPRWLRLEYWRQVAGPLVFVEDRRSPPALSHALEVKDLHTSFCALVRDDPKAEYLYSTVGKDELRDHLLSCDWWKFYDFVELAWRKLRDNPRCSALERTVSAREYASAVNSFFSSFSVAWQLSDEGELHRVLGSSLADALSRATDVVADHPAARRLLEKAISFLSSRGLDPENAVKEAVSAAESFGREIYSNAKTLGGVLDRLRKDDSFPHHIVEVMDKVWAYANSKAGVRHGGPDPSSVSQADADFFAQICAAFVVRLAAHTS